MNQSNQLVNTEFQTGNLVFNYRKLYQIAAEKCQPIPKCRALSTRGA